MNSFKIRLIDMIRRLAVVSLVLSGQFLISGCSDSGDSVQPKGAATVSLTVNGFDALTSGSYEAWVVEQATYSSLGKFNLNANGDVVDLQGQPITQFASPADLSIASRIAITIEPAGDNNSIPSAVEVLSGMITSDTIQLGFKVDYTGRSGNYVVITPSDGGGRTFSPNPDTTRPFCGFWFISKPWGEPEIGLSLNSPPAGWKYEGWLLHPTLGWISTGKFSDKLLADDANMYLDNLDPITVDSFFHFPGEDFLVNQPSNLPPGTFPLDVRGSMVFVTLEPEPDNSPEPFEWFVLYCHTVANDVPNNVSIALDTPDMPTATAILK